MIIIWVQDHHMDALGHIILNERSNTRLHIMVLFYMKYLEKANP